MVQKNGNKQNFKINSATPSNTANRTLESIYHTVKFVFSVRPEVKLDVHPCGLDCICEHQCATKLTQRLTEWCVSPSLYRTISVLVYNLNIRQHVSTIVINRMSSQALS